MRILLLFLLLGLNISYSMDHHVIDPLNEEKTFFYIYPTALNQSGGEASDAKIIQEELQDAGAQYGVGGAAVGAAAGGCCGGCVGAVIGGCLGGCLGSHCGAKARAKTVYHDIKWIESSCLDLVFRTKKGDDVIYDLMIRLRPVAPGWRRSTKDRNKPFNSKIHVYWSISNSAEDRHGKNSYNSVFPNNRVQELENLLKQPQPLPGCCGFLTCSSQKGNFMEFSSAEHIKSSRLNSDSVFDGQLKSRRSIEYIIEIVNQMKVKGKFPSCSWSGKSKKSWCSKEKDVLNPVIFTCKLLYQLGGFSNVSDGTFDATFLGSAPITREQVIKNLYTHVESLMIRANTPLIENLIETSENNKV